MAEWTEQTSGTIRDFTMGSFVTNDKTGAGIRSHPYSTSK
jgi:extracellular elastinolytic metalloproteinase